MPKEMLMFDPPHPGELLREDYIQPMIDAGKNLSITQIAKDLGVGRQTLSNLLNERTGISPEMAIRLEKAFSNTTAGYWLNLQKSYNLWQAKQQVDVKDVVSYPLREENTQKKMRV